MQEHQDKHLILDGADALCEALGYKHVQRAYDDIKDGTLTTPVKCGRSSRWPRHEVQAIVATRIAGSSKAEIRELVIRLTELRARLVSTRRVA